MQNYKILLLMILLLGACSNEETPSSNFMELSEIYGEVDWLPINLNEVEVDTLFPVKILDFVDQSIIDNAGFLKYIKYIAANDNHVFIFTHESPFIAKFTTKGDFIDAPIRTGQGPAELESVTQVTESQSDSLILITDGQNGRVQQYDLDLNHKGSIVDIPIDFSHSRTNGFVTNNSIYLPLNVDNELVAKINLGDPSQLTSKLLHRLVPSGFQPMALNYYNGAADNQGNVYFSYKGLNFLLKYNQTDSLVAVYEVLDASMEKYITDLTTIERNPTTVGVTDIISYFGFLTNDYALIAKYNVLSVVKFSPNGKIRVIGRYNLSDVTTNGDSKSIYIQYVAANSSSIFVTSMYDTNALYEIPISTILKGN